ncbi:hypothetical protein ACLB1T_17850 [Escherichia coli]
MVNVALLLRCWDVRLLFGAQIRARAGGSGIPEIEGALILTSCSLAGVYCR